MFNLYILTLQFQRLCALCLGLGPLLKGKMDWNKAFKVTESLFWIITTIFAAFIIIMGIVTAVVIRAIWSFK